MVKSEFHGVRLVFSWPPFLKVVHSKRKDDECVKFYAC